MVDATPLIFPQLGPIYQALFPWAEALLRAVAGLTLVPHGLRSTFGMFPSTGAQSHNLTEFANELDRGGYHPGKFWAPAIVLTQIVAGPMLALGLFTRLAACPIVVFLIVSNYERWRVGGFFWNKMGRIHADVDRGRPLFDPYVMETAGHREPCDSRGSCTVLGAPAGETPSGDSSSLP